MQLHKGSVKMDEYYGMYYLNGRSSCFAGRLSMIHHWYVQWPGSILHNTLLANCALSCLIRFVSEAHQLNSLLCSVETHRLNSNPGSQHRIFITNKLNYFSCENTPIDLSPYHLWMRREVPLWLNFSDCYLKRSMVTDNIIFRYTSETQIQL